MRPAEVGTGRSLAREVEVLGPWSASTSRAFWEGFAPARLPVSTGSTGDEGDDADGRTTTTFCCEADWAPAHAVVVQRGSTAHVRVSGPGDLEAAAEQVVRFLALDVDAREWPAVGERDPVIAAAQEALPGLRPCGFHSPYEAAAWAVLSQRVRISQAARLRADLVARHGAEGSFPAPDRLRTLDLDLPGRKGDHLRAVAEAALEGLLDGPALKAMTADEAIAAVRRIEGLGPFSAELVVLRGANLPDGLSLHEGRLALEVDEQYGPGADLVQLSEAWRPFRTWAAVHLRAVREHRGGASRASGAMAST